MIFYILLEILGISLFVLLGYFEITGLTGFLISMVGLSMIIYSTYNLYKKSKIFREFICLLLSFVSSVPIDDTESSNLKKTSSKS